MRDTKILSGRPKPHAHHSMKQRSIRKITNFAYYGKTRKQAGKFATAYTNHV